LKPLRADPSAAQSLIESSTFVWHQRFELAPGVVTPGVNDIGFLYSLTGLPDDLSGASVLDIGTTNGGGAFEAERRGASRVVAVDILDPSWFGFDRLHGLLGSSVEFRRGSVYELSSLFGAEQFDIVLFWGVLYHLRHPLLALDQVREVAADRVYVETAVADWEMAEEYRRRPLASFYRRDELGADPSNWFAPTAALLGDWLGSSGFRVDDLRPFGDHEGPKRAHASCAVTSGEPEWRELSYEAPLRVVVPTMHDHGTDHFAATGGQAGAHSASRLTYQLIGDLSRRWDKVHREPAGGPFPLGDLTRYELRVFSQNGEDGVLAEIMRRVGATNREFVEFGVESGAEGNCVFLADVLGWSGAFLEADPALSARLSAKYRWTNRVRTLNAKVEPDNVERLLRRLAVPDEPDVLSIDVDGADYWIWAAMDSIRPRVLIIECNTALDPERRIVQPDDPGITWQGTDYYGASVGALAAHGASKGYELVYVDLAGVNAFFVRADHPLGWPDQVPRRGPNLWLSASGHPADPTGRRYRDLDRE
jgi:SAM-dependent methyltransferase